MHTRLATPVRIATLLALAAAPAAAGGIAWQTSWDKTLERAAAEKKVVFLAVNMDGERANDRMVAKVYTNKAVVELSARTLNLAASAAEHAPMDKPCPRFDGVRCQDHRRVDSGARKEVLKADSQGLVIAPQHVFLGPDQAVLLSVPYEITVDELVWCFVTALQRADAATAPPMPAGARMPRRAILAGVHDPSGATGSVVPPTAKEVQEIITRIKKGMQGPERIEAYRQLVLSDDPDALEFIGLELKSAGWGGGGGGPGGGGPGGGGGGRGAGGNEKNRLLLKAIGILSPPVYWEMVADFTTNNDPALRREAYVALEQLAAPKALPALHKALAAEKDPAYQKDVLRALGSCGAADARTRALLLKKAKQDKNASLRANALLALAWSAGEADVRDLLRATLEKGDDPDRAAAALAAGIARDAGWIADLDKAAAAAADPGAKSAVAAAKSVLEGGALNLLRDEVVRVGGDEVVRERFFGRAREGEGR